jgi:hypothetical protein
MKKTNLLLAITMIGVMFITSQCATIMSGSKQDIPITSSPSGASISVDGEMMGITPVTIKLKRNMKNVALKIELDGYKPYQTNLSRGMNGWIFGNIILGGIPGLIIDAATGSMYKLTPESVTASLEKDHDADFEQGIGINNENDVFYVILKKNYQGDDTAFIDNMIKE